MIHECKFKPCLDCINVVMTFKQIKAYDIKDHPFCSIKNLVMPGIKILWETLKTHTSLHGEINAKNN